MTYHANERDNIHRFILGDPNVDSLDLVFTSTTDRHEDALLFRRLLVALKSGENGVRKMKFMRLTIAYGLRGGTMDLFVDALAHMKIRDVNILEIRFLYGSSLLETHILRALEQSNISVEDLRINFQVKNNNSFTHLSKFLVSTKHTLRKLQICSVCCTSQHHASTLGQALQRLELSSLDMISKPGDDPTYVLQLHLMMSDMKIVQHLRLDPPVIFLKENRMVADCIFQIQLPKLTSLKHLSVDLDGDMYQERSMTPTDRDDGTADVCQRLSAAIVSHPSIESLKINCHYLGLTSLKCMVPAFKKCKTLMLHISFSVRPMELEAFSYILHECSHLESLNILAAPAREELFQYLHLLRGYSSLKTLNLCGERYERRDRASFPTPREKDAIVDLARSLPQLTTFKVFKMGDCYELSEQLALNYIRYNDLVADRIPLEEWPTIIAKQYQADNMFPETLNLEMVYRLLHAKVDVLFRPSNTDQHVER